MTIRFIHNTGIGKKLFVASILPLVLLTLFAGIFWMSAYTKSEQAELAQEIIQLVVALDNVAHNHAVERGLTAGFLGSGGTSPRDKLDNQRQKADTTVTELRSVQATLSESLGVLEKQVITPVLEFVNQKQSIRDQVDELSANVNAFAYYSGLNRLVLDGIAQSSAYVQDPELTVEIKLLVAILWLKERAGQERGIVNGVFSKDFASEKAKLLSDTFISEQTLLIKQLELATITSITDGIKALKTSASQKKVNQFRAIYQQKKDVGNFGVNPSEWFGATTKRIGAIKSLAINLSQSIQDRSQGKAELYRATSLFVIFFGLPLLAILFFIVSITLVSIRSRVILIKSALSTMMSSGHLDMRVPTQYADEIGDIAEAFNQFLQEIENLVRNVLVVTEALEAKSSEFMDAAQSSQTLIDKQRLETDGLASAATQMASSISEVATNTASAAGVTEEVKSNGERSNQTVHNTVDMVTQLSQRIENAVTTIQTLAASSQEIGSILETIQGIAEQTNLLALNAAIEAARAGEQGRGFAVVADEVRSLAKRTQESTAEIHSMIENLQSQAKEAQDEMNKSRELTQKSVDSTQETGAAMDTLFELIEKTGDLNKQIRFATEQQTTVADEIHQNTTHISNLAHDSQSSSEATKQASLALQGIAQHLNELVATFKVSNLEEFKEKYRKQLGY